MEHNHILIAEDDPDITEGLSLYLRSAGFIVSSALDGESALLLFRTKPFSLVLVDIMMPKMNGYELIQEIRKTSNLPVIVLSAKNLDTDKILGLDIGADAYITKPFNPLEVLAYVKSAHRRYYDLGGQADNEKKQKPIQIGELVLDSKRFEVTKNGELLCLTVTEFKILSKLMQNPNRVFTKAQLYECINGEYFESDSNTIMVHISNLRSKVEDNPSQPRYIKTVRGLGYKIEA